VYYFIACSCYDSLEESQAVYQVLIAHGWNVLYVIDDHEMLPDFYRPDGNSYYTISAACPGTILVSCSTK
jgi:hypothetical protein